MGSIYIYKNRRRTETIPIPEIKEPFQPTRFMRVKNGVRRFLELDEIDYELKAK